MGIFAPEEGWGGLANFASFLEYFEAKIISGEKRGATEPLVDKLGNSSPKLG